MTTRCALILALATLTGCAALTDEQHASVIEQMQRIATITTSKDVTFA